MDIQIDTREKARAISKILNTFDAEGVKYFSSKLYSGDYMNLDNPRIVVERKQNLNELCTNVCQKHEQFRAELVRAREHGIKVVILVEHGNQIKSMEDVAGWVNPRSQKRIKKEGRWVTIQTKATTGDTLFKILNTLIRKYDCEFVFCEKKDTGRKIIELLGGGCHETGREKGNYQSNQNSA